MAHTANPSATPIGGIFLPIIFFGSFAFFYLFLPPLFADTDTPWHIATGDLIRELGRVPLEDSWSYTAHGAFWLNYSWGWDLILSWLNSVVGLEGLFVIAAGWMAGLTTLMAVVLLKRGGASQDPVMIVVAIAAMVLLTNMGFRPQSFSYLAALIVHTMLHFNRDSDRPQRILWMLPLFMILWVNMHSGFIFGFILLGAYGLEAMMQKDRERFKRLIITGVLCFGAIHVTPLFPALGIGYLPAVVGAISTEANQYIKEWHPYRFQLYAGFDVLLLVLFLALNFREKTLPYADRIITAAWVVASLSSMRNFAILAIISAPMLAMCLEKALLHKSEGTLLRKKGGVVAWGGATILCALLALSPARMLITQNNTVIEKTMTPINALSFLRENYAGVRLFNSWGFGGYTIYYNRDVQKVIMDGRASTVYPTDMLKAFIDYNQGTGTEDFVAPYNLQGYFLMNQESPALVQALATDSAWSLVYQDDIASIFVLAELADVTEIHPRKKLKEASH